MSSAPPLLYMENVITNNKVLVPWVEIILFLRLVSFILAMEEEGRLQRYCDITCIVVASLFAIYLLFRLICRHPLVWRILDCFSCQWIQGVTRSLTEHLALLQCRIRQELPSNITWASVRNFSLTVYGLVRRLLERIRRRFSSARFYSTLSSQFLSSTVDDESSETDVLLSAPEPLVMERQSESSEGILVSDHTDHDKKA